MFIVLVVVVVVEFVLVVGLLLVAALIFAQSFLIPLFCFGLGCDDSIVH